MRGVVVCSLLVVSSVARADVLALVLDGEPPSTPATSGPSVAPTDPSDLIAWAGSPRPITLPELLQLAIRQSPTLQNAKLDIAVAEAQIAETWERHDWTLTAQLSGSHTGAGVFSGIPISSTTNYGLTADISRLLPTGGTVDLHVASQYSDTGIEIPGFSSSYWNDIVTGSITQPLLKNRGSDYYNASERKATLTRDAAWCSLAGTPPCRR